MLFLSTISEWSPLSTLWLLLFPRTLAGMHTLLVKLTVTATSRVNVSILVGTLTARLGQSTCT